MALDNKDVEVIERLIYKSADDIAISIARSFERLEERMVAGEARIYERICQVEDSVHETINDMHKDIETMGKFVAELGLLIKNNIVE